MYSRAIDTRKNPAEKLTRSQRGRRKPQSAIAIATPTPIARRARGSPGAYTNSSALSDRLASTAT
jgi:hypothetical protein